MGRFFSLIHHHPKLLRCLVEEGKQAFELPSGYPLAGWGLGYHQGSRVLIQKEPLVGGAKLPDWPAVTGAVESSDLVCHVHRPPEGRWTFENAQPFGHQGWVCAHHGRIPGHDESREMRLAMLEGVAPFLRRNIQGCSDTEILFHLYLTELHQRHRLPGVRVDPAGATEAMQALVARLEELVLRHCGRNALPELHLTLIVSSGDVVVASVVGVPLHVRRVTAIPVCPVCSAGRSRPEGHPELAASWLASGLTLDGAEPGPSWRAVPDRSVVWANRFGEVQVTPLGGDFRTRTPL